MNHLPWATRRNAEVKGEGSTKADEAKCEQAGGLGRAALVREGGGVVVSVFFLLFCSRAHSLFHLRIVLIILELYRVFVFFFSRTSTQRNSSCCCVYVYVCVCVTHCKH